MKYSLVIRQLIADSIEAVAMAIPFDAIVFIPNCDKVVPGMLIAAARLNTHQNILDKVKQLAQHYQKRIGEDPEAFVMGLGHQVGQGDWRLNFMQMDTVRQITLDDIRQTARRWLVRDNRTTAWYLPTSKPLRAPQANPSRLSSTSIEIHQVLYRRLCYPFDSSNPKHIQRSIEKAPNSPPPPAITTLRIVSPSHFIDWYAASARIREAGKSKILSVCSAASPHHHCTYSPAGSNRFCWLSGLKIRKYEAESTPHPATHCQLKGLLAGSASTRVSQNHASPTRQSQSMCFVRKEAVTIRTRLCIKPVSQSSRIPASTSAKPVSPRCHARKPAASGSRYGMS